MEKVFYIIQRMEKKKYEGSYYNDIMEGNGTYYYKNGKYYIGNFKNGLKEGNGNLYSEDGDLIYSGDFKISMKVLVNYIKNLMYCFKLVKVHYPNLNMK